MSDKTLKFLYYLAWAIGIFAVAVLAYGIIDSLVS